MNADARNDRARGLAIALIRWALGVMFLVGGVSKLSKVTGFVTGYLVPAFAKTFLPGWMVCGYGYALPFVEAILGVLLLVGVCRAAALLVTGLTLISLAFGQMLIQGNAVVANIMLYLLMTAVALYGQAYDTWTICGCGCCRGRTDGQGRDSASLAR
jgi:thiosulfate dehydrogenase [quinone] large subunit